jgi:hypothetical protein
MIELEPGLAARDLGHSLDAGGGHGAEDEGHLMLASCLGENLRGAWPHEPLQADGGNAKRSLISLAENLSPQISARIVAEIPRLQAHLADLFSVAAEVHFRETTAFQILKRKARHPPPRPLAQVLNGRILGMEG